MTSLVLNNRALAFILVAALERALWQAVFNSPEYAYSELLGYRYVRRTCVRDERSSIKSRSSSKLGHVGSKTRSLVQILEIPRVHSKGTVLINRSRNFVRIIISLCAL